jgi:ADP-ribose pyrophosphatase YjhB (NUDIX family)
MKKNKIKKIKTIPKKAKFELSAGGIVYNPELKKILVIEAADGRISLPKGHNKKSESMIETAKREIAEETDVKNLEFIAKIGEPTYFFKFKNEFIFKKVVCFLFITNNLKAKPQLSEIKSAQFESISEIKKVITFKNLLPLLDKAEKLIKEKYGR